MTERDSNHLNRFLSTRISWESRYYLLCLTLITLFLWLIAKSILFQNLEYTSDLFSHLQMSKFSFEKGLLFTNEWGRMSAIHNCYTILLFSPFTFAFGAYGLFIGTTFLYLLALWRLIALPDQLQSVQGKIAIIIAILGPTGFWLFDDPIYGWNLELNFVPMGILLAVSLIEQKFAWVAVSSILLALTKEDGPVLACTIFVAHEILVRRNSPERSIPYGETAMRVAKLCALWSVVFFLGLLLIHFQKTYSAVAGQTDYGGRLISATIRLFDSFNRPDGMNELRSMYVGSLVLISATLVAIPTQLFKVAAAYLLASIPIYLIIAIPSFAYAGTYHGLLWPPRFALLWSLAISLMMFFSSTETKPTTAARQAVYLMAIAASLVLQVKALSYYRTYSFIDRISYPLGLGRGDNLVSSQLSSTEIKFVECLADGVKQPSSVLTEGSLFALFHRHDIVFPAQVHHAWRTPVLAVCDLQRRLPFNSKCLDFVLQKRSDSAWQASQKGAILAIAFDSLVNQVLSACAATNRGD